MIAQHKRQNDAREVIRTTAEGMALFSAAHVLSPPTEPAGLLLPPEAASSQSMLHGIPMMPTGLLATPGAMGDAGYGPPYAGGRKRGRGPPPHAMGREGHSGGYAAAPHRRAAPAQPVVQRHRACPAAMLMFVGRQWADNPASAQAALMALDVDDSDSTEEHGGAAPLPATVAFAHLWSNATLTDVCRRVPSELVAAMEAAAGPPPSSTPPVRSDDAAADAAPTAPHRDAPNAETPAVNTATATSVAASMPVVSAVVPRLDWVLSASYYDASGSVARRQLGRVAATHAVGSRGSGYVPHHSAFDDRAATLLQVGWVPGDPVIVTAEWLVPRSAALFTAPVPSVAGPVFTVEGEDGGGLVAPEDGEATNKFVVAPADDAMVAPEDA